MFRSAAEVGAHDRAEIATWLRGVPFEGQVLDYGCGRKPYRDIIAAAGATYVGWDSSRLPDSQWRGGEHPSPLANADWDTILCTQVLTLVPDPREFLELLAGCANRLVLTVSLGYRPFHPQDRWRFTPAGLAQVLDEAGWCYRDLEVIWSVSLAPDYEIPMTLGAVCW